MKKRLFTKTAWFLGLGLIIACNSAWALVNDGDVWGNGIAAINGVETAHDINAIVNARKASERVEVVDSAALGTFAVDSSGTFSLAGRDANGLKRVTTANTFPEYITIELGNVTPYTPPASLGSLLLDPDSNQELRIKLDYPNLADGTYQLLHVDHFMLGGQEVTASEALTHFSQLTIYWGDWDGHHAVIYSSSNPDDWHEVYVLSDNGRSQFNLMFTKAAVPEPGTFVLMGLGVLSVLFMARRRKAAK